MRIDMITLFPQMVLAITEESILKRAQEKGLMTLRVHQLRDYANDRHRTVDDPPYGGGPGMVLKPEPIFSCITAIRSEGDPLRILMPAPQGRVYDQEFAQELSRESRRLVIVCGHYEGIDARVRIGLPAEEFSIGDYVLTGGELPGLVVLDSVVRLIPGVLGDPDSARSESFSEHLLEHPQYTRPAVYQGISVPDVLRSGNHAAIARWRRQQSLRETRQRRPDLLDKARRGDQVSPRDWALLEDPDPS